MTASTATTKAIDRAFTAYSNYSAAPDERALLALLAELEHLDAVLAVDRNRLTFFAFAEYHALKAMLDHAKHLGAGRGFVRLRKLPVTRVHSDTKQACLVSRGDCHAALLAVAAHSRMRAKRAVFSAFQQWGPVLDISPSIHNCLVKVFEALQSIGIGGTSAAYKAFRDCYEEQALSQIPHLATGVVAHKDSDEHQLLGLMTSLYLQDVAHA